MLYCVELVEDLLFFFFLCLTQDFVVPVQTIPNVVTDNYVRGIFDHEICYLLGAILPLIRSPLFFNLSCSSQ